MNAVPEHERELENRLTHKLLDVLIRAGLVVVLVVVCYQVFAPFASLMA